MKTSLLDTLQPPPNITAWLSSTLVREKAAQGGGLTPLTAGEDHTPKKVKHTRWGLSRVKIKIA